MHVQCELICSIISPPAHTHKLFFFFPQKYIDQTNTNSGWCEGAVGAQFLHAVVCSTHLDALGNAEMLCVLGMEVFCNLRVGAWI